MDRTQLNEPFNDELDSELEDELENIEVANKDEREENSSEKSIDNIGEIQSDGSEPDLSEGEDGDVKLAKDKAIIFTPLLLYAHHSHKKAFIFGSNYKGTQYELGACVKDCQRVEESLKKRGYSLTTYYQEKVLTWTELYNRLHMFLESLESGDQAIVYYSGHGTQVADNNGDEPDGQDECIFLSGNAYVRDDTLRYMLQRVVENVNILCVFDCCNSGTMADLPYRLDDLHVIKENDFKFKANIITISGCADPKLSYEQDGTGLLTDSFLKVFGGWTAKLAPSLPWLDFYLRIASHLLDKSQEIQFPQLAFTKLGDLKNFWL